MAISIKSSEPEAGATEESSKPMPAAPPAEKDQETVKPECFVIMPIRESDAYPPGHFQRVYEDIFIPACEKAGFQAVRADSVRETNLIHLDILQKILDSPMAICDLSTQNPNVLFELGLRQAFDKPVALVQEAGSTPIFDIAPLRYTEYRKARTYHEVLEDQEEIGVAIKSTFEACQNGEGINSIVRLLALTKPATLAEVSEADKDPVLKVILSELDALRTDMSRAKRKVGPEPNVARVRKQTFPLLVGNVAYVLGGRYKHHSFGEGTLLYFDGTGDSATLLMNFDAHGQKLLDVKFARLSYIEGGKKLDNEQTS